jgi:hypothetical protein
MKFAMTRFWVFTGLLLAVAFGSACSDDAETARPSAPSDPSLDESYAITAYVAEGDAVRTLVFKRDMGAKYDSVSTPLKALDLGFDPGSDGAAPQSVAVTSTSAMKDLARMALSECGLRGMGTMATSATPSNLQLQTTQRTGSCVVRQLATGQAYTRLAATPPNVLPTQPAWVAAEEPSCLGLDASPQPFLFFSFEPKTAAQVLQYEETLVCAASKLAELAESDKPLRWGYALYGLGSVAVAGPTSSFVDLPGYSTSPLAGRTGDLVPQPVTFKVTQPKDRFLVRDLAMELLSYS